MKATAASVSYLGAFLAIICLGWSARGVTSTSPPSPSSSRTATPSAVGLRGYRRFHANDSLINQLTPCTHEEKLCFRINLFYDSAKHDCYEAHIPIGDRDLWYRSGHLKPYIDPQPDFCSGIRMAYDSECYQTELVHNIICGCNQTTFHILGGQECRCSPSAPIHVEQPQEQGRCRIPDLRFPSDRSQFRQSLFKDIEGYKVYRHGSRASEPTPRFKCSSEQAQCFSEGKVWVVQGQGCFPLLEKGPCAEEHVVALDVQAAREGRAEATCVHVRGGCPDGHVRMTFDGQCHSEYDLSVLLPYSKDRNQFGMFFATSCGYKKFEYAPVQESGVSSMCSVTVRVLQDFCVAPAYIPCHCKSGCSRYEVIVKAPKPEE